MSYSREAERSTLFLRDMMESAQGWGRRAGKATAARLQAMLEGGMSCSDVMRLSLSGIEQMDVSFTREIVWLIWHYRCQRGFCLVDMNAEADEEKDWNLFVNWDAAACGRNQPLFSWNTAMQVRLLGHAPTIGLREMLHYVLASSSPVPTTEAAAALHLSLSNASNKLSVLYREGYLLRQSHCAASGGLEHVYYRIA